LPAVSWTNQEKRGVWRSLPIPLEPGGYWHKDKSAMFKHNVTRETKVMLLAGVLASSTLVMPVGAQSPAPTGQPGHAEAKRYQPDRFAGRAGKYYELVWGVDSLAVKWTESGEVIRFTYRVLDADKAKTLNDKKTEPSLIDPQAQVKLTGAGSPGA